MSARELLRLENVPVYQNKMFDSEASARSCPRGSIVLTQNPRTGLIANASFESSKLGYDESYQNEQGLSSTFQRHLLDVLDIVERHLGSSRVLEIGCGKGLFLEQLRKNGHDAWGIDPAYEGNSPHIIKAGFEPSLGIRGEGIVMRHVLEHIPDPASFLDAVRLANGGSGVIYIEVPCLDWILQKHAWFDIFYEHVNYFRLSDFARLFGNVLEAGHLFGGQYLYAVAELASLRGQEMLGVHASVSFPAEFFSSIDRCISKSTNLSRSVIWGGAAKGVMFTHHVLARGHKLDFAIDINPAKQGSFLAGSGLAVLSPEAGLARLGPGSDIFVMNSNYLDEIQEIAGANLNYILVDKT